MHRFAIAAIALSLGAGCGEPIEYGPEKTEAGRVVDLVYVPSGRGSDVAVGVSAQGHTTVTPVSVDIPARFGIVFECEHGTFAIEGRKWVNLWRSLHEGEEVTILYREGWQKDDQGVPQLVDYDFLWADPTSRVGRPKQGAAEPSTTGPA